MNWLKQIFALEYKREHGHAHTHTHILSEGLDSWTWSGEQKRVTIGLNCPERGIDVVNVRNAISSMCWKKENLLVGLHEFQKFDFSYLVPNYST